MRSMMLPLILLVAQFATRSLAHPSLTIVNSISTRDPKVCTVLALGNQTDDVPNILAAFDACNDGGTVIFPENQTYWIAQKLNPVVRDVTVEWRGVWTMSDDLDYWRNNSYPIAFQNHHASFVLSGDGIFIDGYGTGGINGNGNAWYDVEQTVTQPGRPMPFVFWNVSDVSVSHFFVKDPPLWSLNIMNGTNMSFEDITCNATAINAPFGTNWVQNTDGFDTMDSHNITLSSLTYQGGDDCVAIKPRSYNITLTDITCHGGNGIAIGSLGQYLEDSSVANVTITGATLIPANGYIHNGAYIKTWVGELVNQSSYESAGLPRGAGWGVVEGIVFEDFVLEGVGTAAAITEDSGDTSNGTYLGTSNMLIRDILFKDWTGFTSSATNRTAEVICSNRHPCYDIVFEDFEIHPDYNGSVEADTAKCEFIAEGGVVGITGTGC